MSELITRLRGMNDILPTETPRWQWAESILRDTLKQFAFNEIRLPILEKTDLFKRSIGDGTDVIEKEMYTFLDRNNESVSLRPEGTVGCVRAGLEHGLFYNQIQRLWYMGANYRYERPQKGRYRQFHHCGAEVFGIETPDIDAELIALSAAILERCGVLPLVSLQINSLGSSSARAHYRAILVDYLSKNADQLDEDSQRRLTTNPMRILDSKNPAMQSLIQNAPKLMDHLDPESKEHFETLLGFLDAAGIRYDINPCLVRGLDYYSKTVFEWVTNALGAQGTVCAGGRYDGLAEQIGGKHTPALGFAIGVERLILLIEQQQPAFAPKNPDITILSEGQEALKQAFVLSTTLRDVFPDKVILLHCGGGSLKNQFKKADKSGAALAIIIGEEESRNQSVSIKKLREYGEQVSMPKKELVHYLMQSVWMLQG